MCTSGACPPWIQILLESQDSIDQKSIRDIILVPLTKHAGDISRVCDSSLDSVSALETTLNQSQISTLNENEIYILKLEKKVAKISDQ